MKYLMLMTLVLFSLSLSAQTSEPTMPTSFDHNYTSFNSMLSKNVMMKKQGGKSIVKYESISLDEINAVVAEMTQISRDKVMGSFTYKQRLSYFINLYNALTIKLIKDNYSKAKKKGIRYIGDWFGIKGPWDKKKFTVFGVKTSLNEIEHGYIRGDKGGSKFKQSKKEYSDPRIHFAVNCASKGCPALLNQAFTESNLIANMDKAMVAFLKDRDRNKFENGIMNLSMIFKWYEKDFSRGLLGYKSIKDFVMKNAKHLADSPELQTKLSSGQFKLDYTDYDWTLNNSI